NVTRTPPSHGVPPLRSVDVVKEKNPRFSNTRTGVLTVGNGRLQYVASDPKRNSDDFSMDLQNVSVGLAKGDDAVVVGWTGRLPHAEYFRGRTALELNAEKKKENKERLQKEVVVEAKEIIRVI